MGKTFIEILTDTLSRGRYDLTNEKRVQSGIEEVLRTAGFTFIREYRLSEQDRIDFYFPEAKIGLEIKIKGQALQVCRQLSRYARSNDIATLVLFSTRKFVQIPDTLNNKPIISIWQIQI